jgi:hypothetical protein
MMVHGAADYGTVLLKKGIFQKTASNDIRLMRETRRRGSHAVTVSVYHQDECLISE